MAKEFNDKEQAVLIRINWCREWLQDSEDAIYRFDMGNVNLDKVTLALIEARNAGNKVCDLLDEIVDDNNLPLRK